MLSSLNITHVDQIIASCRKNCEETNDPTQLPVRTKLSIVIRSWNHPTAPSQTTVGNRHTTWTTGESLTPQN